MGAAIAILLICNACFVWSTGTRLEARLAALRRAGEPVQLSDLAREPIPPEKNADVFLRRAADDLDAIEKELVASYPKRGYPTGELTPAEQEKLEKLFAAYPRVMPLLEQAADCPDSDPQLDTTLLPSRFLEPYMNHSTKHRVLIRVSRARSAWLLSRGRADDALAGQILMLRLTRHWRHEPLLIGYLVTPVWKRSAMDQAPVPNGLRDARYRPHNAPGGSTPSGPASGIDGGIYLGAPERTGHVSATVEFHYSQRPGCSGLLADAGLRFPAGKACTSSDLDVFHLFGYRYGFIPRWSQVGNRTRTSRRPSIIRQQAHRGQAANPAGADLWPSSGR